MSPSGRFQSRVLSFLSQQRLRLQDQVQRLWRRSQVTAVWSAQILLYPIYVAFQTTRLLGSRVSRAAQRLVPGLQAADPDLEQPATDAPIQKTLQAVWSVLTPQPLNAPQTAIRLSGHPGQPGDNFSLTAPAAPPGQLILRSPASLAPTAPSPASLLPPTLAPHGIASLLSTHALVLVTERGDILDILTPAQQLWLQQRMAWELAGFWRDRRLFERGHRPANFLPPTHAPRHALPPVRAFLRLMGWMQRSPVAIATNLFQEAALVQYFAAPNGQPGFNLPGEQDEWWLQGSASPALPLPPRPFDPDTFDAATQSYQVLPTSPSVGYLSSSASQPQQPQRSLQKSFQKLAEQGDRATDLLRVAAPSRGHVATVNRGNLQSPLSRAKAPRAAASGAVDSTTSTLQPVPPGAYPPDTYPPSPYIETKASLVTYVKHPLEQLLEWLDRSMLWVEEHWLSFWHWLTLPRGQ